MNLNNLTLLVGNNGSGKTSFISNLAEAENEENYKWISLIDSYKTMYDEDKNVNPAIALEEAPPDIYSQTKAFLRLLVGCEHEYAELFIYHTLLNLDKNIIFIENPEIGLSDDPCSCMGVFFSECTKTGTRIVVETHSEDIIYGVRFLILNKMIDHRDVDLLFFNKGSITRTSFDKDGRYKEYPEGLFAHREKLMAMFL